MEVTQFDHFTLILYLNAYFLMASLYVPFRRATSHFHTFVVKVFIKFLSFSSAMPTLFFKIVVSLIDVFTRGCLKIWIQMFREFVAIA